MTKDREALLQSLLNEVDRLLAEEELLLARARLAMLVDDIPGIRLSDAHSVSFEVLSA